MSRRKKITIIVVLIAFVIGGLLLFLEFGEQATEPDEPPTQDEPIFPFATTTDFFAESEDGGISTTTPTDTNEDRPELWRISDDPVAGSRWINQDGSNRDTIQFVKQENGHVFSANPDTREVKQLTNVTVPQVKEALIGSDGRRIILRYLDDDSTIQTYNARLTESEDGSDAPYTLEGSFLAPDIYGIAMAPSDNRLFYLQETNGRSVGVLHNLEEDSRKQILTSEVTRWRTNFTQDDAVTIFTPPADDIDGYGYYLDTETGQQEKITDAAGLSVKTNPDGSVHMQTRQRDGSFETYIQNGDQQFRIKSFSEKCFWESENIIFCGVPENQEPNSVTEWYQGRVNFVDDIHLFNTESGSRDQLLSNDQIERASADMIDFDINQSFTELIFTDKTSGDLWGFRL